MALTNKNITSLIEFFFIITNITGATVVSWRVNNQEQLFVRYVHSGSRLSTNHPPFFSKQAVFDGKKAIRGGIPFVFRK
jgi:glucose-6-phosphate 1-epimerase